MTDENDQPRWFGEDPPHHDPAELVAKRDELIGVLRHTVDPTERSQVAARLREVSDQLDEGLIAASLHDWPVPDEAPAEEEFDEISDEEPAGQVGQPAASQPTEQPEAEQSPFDQPTGEQPIARVADDRDPMDGRSPLDEPLYEQPLDEQQLYEQQAPPRASTFGTDAREAEAFPTDDQLAHDQQPAPDPAYGSQHDSGPAENQHRPDQSDQAHQPHQQDQPGQANQSLQHDQPGQADQSVQH
ncbi:MAG: hypothetical protein ACR2QK_11020, partial [Acidimicrobiales bacterium]